MRVRTHHPMTCLLPSPLIATLHCVVHDWISILRSVTCGILCAMRNSISSSAIFQFIARAACCFVLFANVAHVDIVHVPYKGAAPAVTDLIAGHVSIMFDNLASALPQIKAGRTRALAVTTLARSAMVPDLPTIDESGLKGFDLSTWFGIFAPAGVPSSTLSALHREITRALDSADLRSRLAAIGAQPAPNTPEAFAAFIKAEHAKYAQVIKVSGARVE